MMEADYQVVCAVKFVPVVAHANHTCTNNQVQQYIIITDDIKYIKRI